MQKLAKKPLFFPFLHSLLYWLYRQKTDKNRPEKTSKKILDRAFFCWYYRV